MSYETFYEILMASLVILPFAISFWVRFCKISERSTIIHHHPLIQTAKTIINYHAEFEHVQTVLV